jgi:hypothetical protein
LAALSLIGTVATALHTSSNIGLNVLWLLVWLLITIGSFAGMRALSQRANNPAAFTPSYAPIAPTTRGAAFEVNFQRPWLRAGLGGRGVIRFAPEHLIVDGLRATAAWHPLPPGYLLAKALHAGLHTVGLGLLPVAHMIPKLPWPQEHQEIPYRALRDVEIRGCRLTCIIDGPQQSEQLRLAVSVADGERFYRELSPRFPGALGGWQP